MRSIVVLFAVAALAACGDDGFETDRDVIKAISNGICERRSVCDGFTQAEFDDCVSLFIAAHCDDRDCNAPPVASEEAVNDCLDALAVISCDALLPEPCTDLLFRPL